MTYKDDKYKKEVIKQLLGINDSELAALMEVESNISLDLLFAYAQKQHDEKIFFDGLKRTFERNMRFFESYKPEIYKVFYEYKPSESFEFIKSGSCADMVFVASDTYLYGKNDARADILKMVRTEYKNFVFKKKIYGQAVDNYGQLYHRYFNEAAALCAKYDSKRSVNVSNIGVIPHFLIMGVGLGYCLEAYFKVFSVQTAIIAEPNADVFYASLYTTDYETLIKGHDALQSIEFVVGSEGLDLVLKLNEIYLREGRFLQSMRIGALGFFNDNYKKLLEYVLSNLDRAYTAIGFPDDIMFGLSQSIDNLKHGVRLAGMDIALPERYQNTRAFVVGNGPSLDNDIAFLRASQDKAYIIACGSAIDTLYNVGIKPDAYVATERINGIAQTLDVFKGTDFLSDIVLMTTSVTHPDTISRFPRSLIFAKIGESAVPVFAKSSVYSTLYDNWKGLNFINPLVGNAGLDIAVNLGFKEIYLFGIDNGVVVDGDKRHSAHSSFYNKLGFEEKSSIDGDEIILDGNFRTCVKSNALYKHSRDCLDMLLSLEPHVKCYNCSDGARLCNAIAIKSCDIDMAGIENPDKSFLNNYFTYEKGFICDFDEEEIKDYFQADFFAGIVNKIKQIFAVEAKNRSDLLCQMREVSRYIYSLDSIENSYAAAMIISSACDNFFTLCMDYIYTIKNKKEALKLGLYIIKRLLYLLDDLIAIYAFMPGYIQDRHIELLHGSIGFDHEDSKAPLFNKHFQIHKEGTVPVKSESFIKRYE